MRKTVIYAGYILAAILITFAGQPAVYAGCQQGNCQNGPGRYAWPDGSSYAGDFLKGKFHGRGTYAWADGKKYIGEFKNDKRNGVGTYTWPNGASYNGEWENGKKAGYGIYTFPDGRKSIGLWENGTLSQEMEEAEVMGLLAAQPKPGPAPAAAAQPASSAAADADLDKQLAALGGAPATTPAPGEESIPAAEAAAPGPPTVVSTPFIVSVRKLPLADGRKFKTWENIPLLAVGPITSVGTCTIKIAAEASDPNAGKLTVKLKIANSSGCPLDFKGFIQAGDYYVKVVSWTGDQAVAPGGEKEVSRAVTLEKGAPRSKILFKLQGAGCRM